MSGRFNDFGGRPRLLLAYADAAYASECGRCFRRLGWEVEMVASGSEARGLVSAFCPHVVVLDVELLDESGWLTSAKISSEDRNLRIILVAEDGAGQIQERVHMVGAEQAVCRHEGAEALANAILGKPSFSEAV